MAIVEFDFISIVSDSKFMNLNSFVEFIFYLRRLSFFRWNGLGIVLSHILKTKKTLMRPLVVLVWTILSKNKKILKIMTKPGVW